jgi:hypothetical protein
MEGRNMIEKKHIEDLKKSGLNKETIKRYGFYSVTKEGASELLKFRAPSGGWVVKYPNSDFFKIRFDKPQGERKYLSPRNSKQDLFITKLAENSFNTQEPYFFIEGEKKCLALEQAGYASIGIPGVWAWKSMNHANEELYKINIRNRKCFIIFDSDKYENKHVLKAEEQLAETLISLGSEVKIVNLDKEFGKGADDQLVCLGRKDFHYYIEKAKDYKKEEKDEPPVSKLITQEELMDLDIPPIDYYITDLIPKQSKILVSGSANLGKSFFVMNLSTAIATGKEFLSDRFDTKTTGKIMYLDCEMGPSGVKERFSKMKIETKNIYLSPYFLSIDLNTEQGKKTVEFWLQEYKPNILIIDPIGSAWHGDENNKQEVSRFTSYLNTLINKHDISIVLVKHWRKKTKGATSGGEMVSGSHHWLDWCEVHVALGGKDAKSVAISCEKARHFPRFDPFIIGLDEKTLSFQFVGDYSTKYDESTLIKVFEECAEDRNAVPVAELVKYAKEKEICSEGTMRNLIKTSKDFAIDKSKRKHYLHKKQNNDGTNLVDNF